MYQIKDTVCGCLGFLLLHPAQVLVTRADQLLFYAEKLMGWTIFKLKQEGVLLWFTSHSPESWKRYTLMKRRHLVLT